MFWRRNLSVHRAAELYYNGHDDNDGQFVNSNAEEVWVSVFFGYSHLTILHLLFFFLKKMITLNWGYDGLYSIFNYLSWFILK